MNFRTGPSTVYPVIKKLDIGTPLEFLAAVKEGWVQVVYSGVTGYVSLKYITPVVLQMPSARPVSVSEGSKTHVLNAQIDVRSGPGTGYAKVGPVYPGDFVGVLSINNSWAKINYYDQSVLKNGYLNTSFISPQATTEGGIPRIGIVYTTSKLTHYIDAIKRAGGEAVLLPMAASKAHAEELAASVSGLLLPGGNSSSDSDSFMIQAALAMDKPTLGICLGFQAINSASGGGLSDLVIEDFERSRIHRDPDIRAYRHHKIVIQDDSILAGLVGTGTDVVNSFHRHILSSGGANIETMAMSPDGAIEGIQRKDKTFVIGVAFHPERLYAGGNTIYHSLFIELIRQARLQ